MTINRFEDIKAWQDARALTTEIYKLCSDGKPSKDFGFRDQIQRVCISVMSNIAEGFERNNNKEFIKFLLYSKGSCGEVRSLLIVARDLNYIVDEQYKKLVEVSILISSQISSFIKYLKKSGLK